MHVKFIDYLCDPITKEKLEIDLSRSKVENGICNDGFLFSSTNSYAIKNGVVRFVDNSNYTESFGWQWNHWSRVQFDSENIGKPMEGHTTMMWESITGIKSNENLKDKITLDLGCGPGRFIEVARNKGAMVIGLDYSRAVDAAHKNFVNDPNVCIIQGDAMNLPIKNDVIDVAFSIGVLHHTPDPKNGVKEIFRTLNKGGWFALAVYGKSGYYDFPTVQMWRKIFKFTWKYFGQWPPLIYTYFVINVFRPLANLSRPLGLAIRVFFPFIFPLLWLLLQLISVPK
jgi:ubiquinone/menaquinone biosynthesis C-methylase UbiE